MSNSKNIAKQSLDFEEVKRLIPQRFPFLMIDRVIEVKPGEKVIAIKNLTGNEWFYQGHFPKKAVTPGAMIVEAIAQAGIVFFRLSRDMQDDVTYLLGGVKIRFLEPAWPGDQLVISVTAQKLTSTAAILSGEVSVNQRVIARGEFSLAAKSNNQL